MFKKALAFIAAAIGFAQLGAQATSTAKSIERVAIATKSVASPYVKTNNRDAVSRALPSSGVRRFLNQRQYRKKVRQNPSLYKSRKHRSRN